MSLPPGLENEPTSTTSGRRRHDRLVGAAWGVGATVVLVLLGLLGAALALSAPADDPSARPGQRSPGGASGPGGSLTPPSDLARGETWLGDLVLDADVVLTPEATLRDVAAVAGGTRSGPDGTTVERLEVEATVPFDVVAAELGPGSTVRAAADGQASVTRDVEALGRVFTVVATGTVEAVDGVIVVEPRSIDVGGADFLGEAVAAAARELVTIEQEVEGLPDGLVLREVEVVPDGFRARLDGEDVRLDVG